MHKATVKLVARDYQTICDIGIEYVNSIVKICKLLLKESWDKMIILKQQVWGVQENTI